MGSMASPNSWSPYNNYRDCSTGICSVYCPQWCYIVFPPPPPSGADDGSGTNFSPLVISIIGILASAFLLIAYYTLISKYCKRRRSSAGAGEVHDESEPTDVSHMHHHDQWQHGGPAAAATSTGLDQSLIESITVCCYKKEDGLLEEGTTECAVCLSEFQENEKIRLLPKCNHAFHVPCIDMWLKSHSNCPLCRANVVSSQPDPVANNASNFNVSLLRVQPTRDVIVVVEDPGTGYRTEGVVENRENGQEIYDKFTSPVSLGSFQCRRHLLVSDVLRISEEEEEEIEIEMGIHRLDMETGSSRGIRDENSMEGERSTSIGRLSWERPDYKGKNSVIPN